MTTQKIIQPLKTHPVLKILFLFIVLALAYSLCVPFGEPPDEPAHYAYIWYLLTYHRLPEQAADLALNPVDEGHHPPLYYAVTALLTGWAPYTLQHPLPNPYLPEGYDDPHVVQQFLHPASERFPWPAPLWAAHIARMVSIGMGVLSVYVTYHIAKHFTSDTSGALLAAATLAFIPQFVYSSSAINNDNAAILMSAITTWQMLRIFQHQAEHTISVVDFLLLGVLVSLGILSKVSLLALGLPIGLTIAHTSFLSKSRWSVTGNPLSIYTKEETPSLTTTRFRCLTTAIARGSLVMLPIVLLTGWWMWRNIQLYGDPVAWNIWMATYARFARRLPLTLSYILNFWWLQFRSFWAVFAWGRIDLPTWVYLGLLGLCLAGAGGLVKYLLCHKEQRPSALLLLSVVAGFLASSWRLGLSLDTTAAQGRFLLPAAPALVPLLASGWLAWRPRKGSKIQRGLTSTLFTLASAALLFRIIPVYAQPTYDALPTKAQPVQAHFGPWALVGWHVPTPETGKSWPITLYWRAERPLKATEKATAPLLFVHLVDSNGNALAKWDGVPTQGRLPPPAWETNVLIANTITLNLPEHIDVPMAHLYVGFYIQEEDNVQYIPVETQTHQALEETLILGPVLFRPNPNPPSPQKQVNDVHFGAVQLLGYDLKLPQADGDETIGLTLHWKAQDSLPADYTVFVHVINAAGLVVQGDAPPCNGQCPTSLWQAGDVWPDEHQIPITALTSEQAPYTLSIGWYDPSTGTRLPAYGVSNQRLVEDRWVLCRLATWPASSCVEDVTKR